MKKNNTFLNSIKSVAKWFKRNDFQKTNNLISLVGVLISLFFALIAIRLTVKYGENTLAIQRFDSIVKNGQEQVKMLEDQTKKLLVLSKTSSSQTDTLVKILNELQTNNHLIENQVNYTQRQLEILNNQFSLSKQQSEHTFHYDSLQQASNYRKFVNSFYRFLDLSYHGNYSVRNYDTLSYPERLQFLLSVEPIFKDMSENPIIYENFELQKSITDFLILLRGELFTCQIVCNVIKIKGVWVIEASTTTNSVKEISNKEIMDMYEKESQKFEAEFSKLLTETQIKILKGELFKSK